MTPSMLMNAVPTLLLHGRVGAAELVGAMANDRRGFAVEGLS